MTSARTTSTRLSDLELLDYLHDAELEDVSYSIRNDGDRTVRIRARAHDECGHEPWNGRIVTVLLSNTLLVVGTLLGHTAGTEFISGFREAVSQETQRRLDEFRAHGIRVPPTQLGIAFNSGSEMEVVCDAVEIEVEGPLPSSTVSQSR